MLSIIKFFVCLLWIKIKPVTNAVKNILVNPIHVLYVLMEWECNCCKRTQRALRLIFKQRQISRRITSVFNVLNMLIVARQMMPVKSQWFSKWYTCILWGLEKNNPGNSSRYYTLVYAYQFLTIPKELHQTSFPGPLCTFLADKVNLRWRSVLLV